MTQQTGFFLSIPVYSQVDPIITSLTDATTIEDAREDAVEASHISFMQAGYESADMAFGTLFQLGANGGLITSECFEVYGPDAQ